MASIYKQKAVWWVSYFVDGKRYQKSLKTRNDEEARLLKAEIELKVSRGTIRPAKPLPIETVVSELLEFVRTSRAARTAKDYKERLALALPRVGVSRITEITPGRLQRFIEDRLKEVKPATVAGDLRVISRLLSFARKRGYIDSNPLEQVDRPTNISRRLPRFLSKEEIKRILQIDGDPAIRAVIATAVYAGLRRGELANLQWEDIDFDKNLIYVRAREDFHLKNWEERAVSLHSRLRAILEPLRKPKGPCFTFDGKPLKPDFLSREVTAALKKAGIKDATLHTLRHTFASQCAMAGISLLKISKWLGHRTPQVTYSVYAHLEPQDGEIERI